MELLKSIIQILAMIAGSLALLMSILLFTRLRWPAAMLFMAKLFTSAFTPLLTLIGAVTAGVGLASGSMFITIIGILMMLIYTTHWFQITRPPDPTTGFEAAFGPEWENRIPAEQKEGFLTKRTVLTLPATPEPRLEQNITFAIVPETGRELLCDLWQPAEDTAPSGLAFLYLHGSAWRLLDKDLGTRPFFRHLAAQGHVIMDVAYRLAPETDLMGMVNDVQRAILWMKENADWFGVDPDHIVLGGGSAGGHLALLTAYTAADPQFTLPWLTGKDRSVRAVVSLYGPTDLEVMYYHTNQHLTTRAEPGRPKKEAPKGMPEWMVKNMGDDYYRLGFNKGLEDAGAFAPLLGGHPDECPEAYAFFSPINYVHANCSPTLLLHGEHDLMAPVQTTRALFRRLSEEKVPAVLHVLPQTDHAFDLIKPNISPPAHNAIYDVERFLGLMAGDLVQHLKSKSYLSIHDF